MDISPKRTIIIAGVAVLLGGGILYYQDSQYSPSKARQNQMATEQAKVSPSPSPKTTAAKAPSPTPSPTPKKTSTASAQDVTADKLGPFMAEAIQKRKAAPSSGNTTKAASPPSTSGGSAPSSGGGTSGGGTSGGSTAGGTAASQPDSEAGVGDTGFWLEDGTSIRHNSKCDLYKKEDGRACEETDGMACRLCGG